MPKVVVTLCSKLPMVWLIILGVTVNIRVLDRNFIISFLKTNVGKMKLAVRDLLARNVLIMSKCGSAISTAMEWR
jgi:hypothetical protein